VLADDIRNGDTIPIALGRAVVGLMNIEVGAGTNWWASAGFTPSAI
jgi:hypothetical protein